MSKKKTGKGTETIKDEGVVDNLPEVTNEDQKPEEKINEHKYNIETFIEENKNTKSSISGPAFKAWFTIIQERKVGEKLPIKEWEKLFKQFLTEPTQ